VDYALAFNVALDSLPAVRRHAIEVLFARNDYLTSINLAAALGYPTTTARRTAEDLAALKVVTVNKIGPGKADERQLTEWVRAALATVRWHFSLNLTQIRTWTFLAFRRLGCVDTTPWRLTAAATPAIHRIRQCQAENRTGQDSREAPPPPLAG